MILHEALLEVIFGAVEDAEEVAAAHTAVYDTIKVLDGELRKHGLSDLVDLVYQLDSAIGALHAEDIQAAWLAGWRHGRRPELLIFSDAQEIGATYPLSDKAYRHILESSDGPHDGSRSPWLHRPTLTAT